jgi:hypothetical protein
MWILREGPNDIDTEIGDGIEVEQAGPDDEGLNDPQ